MPKTIHDDMGSTPDGVLKSPHHLASERDQRGADEDLNQHVCGLLEECETFLLTQMSDIQDLGERPDEMNAYWSNLQRQVHAASDLLQSTYRDCNPAIQGEYRGTGPPHVGSANWQSPESQSVNSRSPDMRPANSRSPDMRPANSRSSDMRPANPRSSEVRTTNPRSSEVRTANLQSADSQLTGARIATRRGDGVDIIDTVRMVGVGIIDTVWTDGVVIVDTVRMDGVGILWLVPIAPDTGLVGVVPEICAIAEAGRIFAHGHQLRMPPRIRMESGDFVQLCNETRPCIVHIYARSREAGTGAGEHSSGWWGNGEALCDWLRGLDYHLRVVICDTGCSSEHARALTEVVDCVISIHAAVSAQAAQGFVYGFYRALGGDVSVAEAFAEGLAALPPDGCDHSGKPELLVRHGVDAGQICFASRRAGPDE